jgi:hypothetical protein
MHPIFVPTTERCNTHRDMYHFYTSHYLLLAFLLTYHCERLSTWPGNTTATCDFTVDQVIVSIPKDLVLEIPEPRDLATHHTHLPRIAEMYFQVCSPALPGINSEDSGKLAGHRNLIQLGLPVLLAFRWQRTCQELISRCD